MTKRPPVLIAGSDTMLGSALKRLLPQLGYSQVLDDGGVRLTERDEVRELFRKSHPELVIVTGGRSEGIQGNLTRPAQLMEHTLTLSLAVICEAWRAGVPRLVYIGSSCCYPRDCRQPMPETELFGGRTEASSSPYATAKLAAMKLVQAHRAQYGARYISVVPGDMFGPDDDFEPERSHVVPALLRRALEAAEANSRELVVWGSGEPVRDLVYVDDVARAVAFASERYDHDLPLNIGSGAGTSIRLLASTICEVVDFRGKLRFDKSRPDGMPAKVLDSSRLAGLGFAGRTPLRQALLETLRWWREETGR